MLALNSAKHGPFALNRTARPNPNIYRSPTFFLSRSSAFHPGLPGSVCLLRICVRVRACVHACVRACVRACVVNLVILCVMRAAAAAAAAFCCWLWPADASCRTAVMRNHTVRSCCLAVFLRLSAILSTLSLGSSARVDRAFKLRLGQFNGFSVLVDMC